MSHSYIYEIDREKVEALRKILTPEALAQLNTIEFHESIEFETWHKPHASEERCTILSQKERGRRYGYQCMYEEIDYEYKVQYHWPQAYYFWCNSGDTWNYEGIMWILMGMGEGIYSI